MNSRKKGKLFEQKAEEFLKNSGYKILVKNYTSKFGEIDIIAEIDNTIVFIEVKGRLTESFGLGEESITARKIRKITKTALLYIQENDLYDKDLRFDVVAINNNEVCHIKNAFSLE